MKICLSYIQIIFLVSMHQGPDEIAARDGILPCNQPRGGDTGWSKGVIDHTENRFAHSVMLLSPIFF